MDNACKKSSGMRRCVSEIFFLMVIVLMAASFLYFLADSPSFGTPLTTLFLYMVLIYKLSKLLDISEIAVFFDKIVDAIGRRKR
jgi:hypothetical protein